MAEHLVRLDYATLEAQRRNHPAWRLMMAEHAPLVASFLDRVFLQPNVREISQTELRERLEDELYGLRLSLGEGAFPRTAAAYLDEWAADDRGWLRKFYPPGSDEPHFDLTPATEKALGWMSSLSERAFVGTASRLMTVFDLLRQIVSGSETDPQARIAELHRRRDEIDAELRAVVAGEAPLLDDTAIKERFIQLTSTARELLGDFREVAHNFRLLDRRVRERITRWDGARGTLLGEILAERDAIDSSDQGRSFQAFWDFLMSPARQEELTDLLARTLDLPAVVATSPDPRMRRIHRDWLSAGDQAQRTVALLSEQLRRFLDDKALLENRRIMAILRQVEEHALALREHPPGARFFEIDELAATLTVPMERPLFAPPFKPELTTDMLEPAGEDLEPEALFSLVVVDKAKLQANIRHALARQGQLTLGALIEAHPLEHGLAELVTYLTLASEDHRAHTDEDVLEEVTWRDHVGELRVARLQRIIFSGGS